MKPAKRKKTNRSFWLTGAAGFVFAAGLSFAGGNLAATSLERGLIGMLAGMAVCWLSEKFLQTLLVKPETPALDHDETAAAGSRFDVSLPAEPPLDMPQASDFQPWIIGQGAAVGDGQAEKMAQALRAIQE